MTSRRSAAILGAACASRALAGPAALALRGRPRTKWLRRVIVALAAGEALADKLPMAKPRSEPPALAARLVSGAATGSAVGGARGARIGATAALAAAYPSQWARALVVARTGLPDPVVAAAEDALVYGAAWLASEAISRSSTSGRVFL